MPGRSTVGNTDYFKRCDCWTCGAENVLLNDNNNCRECEDKRETKPRKYAGKASGVPPATLWNE